MYVSACMCVCMYACKHVSTHLFIYGVCPLSLNCNLLMVSDPCKCVEILQFSKITFYNEMFNIWVCQYSCSPNHVCMQVHVFVHECICVCSCTVQAKGYLIVNQGGRFGLE